MTNADSRGVGTEQAAKTVFKVAYGWGGRTQLSWSAWATRAEAQAVADGMTCPARLVVESTGEVRDCFGPGSHADTEDDDTAARDAFDDAQSAWPEDF